MFATTDKPSSGVGEWEKRGSAALAIEGPNGSKTDESIFIEVIAPLKTPALKDLSARRYQPHAALGDDTGKIAYHA